MVEEIRTVGEIRRCYEVTDVIDWIPLHFGAKASNLSSTYKYERPSPPPPAVVSSYRSALFGRGYLHLRALVWVSAESKK
jgi:hypothetical protein